MHVQQARLCIRFQKSRSYASHKHCIVYVNGCLFYTESVK